MADQWVQSAAGSGGTTTDSVTLTGVVAGNTIVVWALDGSSQTATMTVSDAQGSYTEQGTEVHTSDFVIARKFTLQNANAGSHTITATGGAGDAMFALATEVTAPTSGAVLGSNAAAQANPGTGTDALSSGTVTGITGASTLIVYSNDTSSVSTSDEPAVGTGFTSRLSGANGTVGAWRISTKGVSTNSAGTATAITGTHNFVTLAVAVLNGGASTIVDEDAEWIQYIQAA